MGKNDLPTTGHDQSGKPLDPAHPWNTETETLDQARLRIVNERLARCEEAWAHGVEGAIYEALEDCHTFGIAPPFWVVTALIENRKRTSKKGTPEKVKDHFQRWDLVEEIYESRKAIAATLKTAQEVENMLARKHRRKAKEVAQLIPTRDGVIDYVAAEILNVSPDTVRDSWKKVRRDTAKTLGPKYYVSKFQ